MDPGGARVLAHAPTQWPLWALHVMSGSVGRVSVSVPIRVGVGGGGAPGGQRVQVIVHRTFVLRFRN